MGNCGAKRAAAKQEIEVGLPSELTLMKKAELQSVLEADGIKRQEGDAWFVVESAWVQRWLAYVQGDDSAKQPGPIKNDKLLVFDQGNNAWIPKPLLRSARREHMGHYRRVNVHVWSKWAGTYRGSGPTIWVAMEPFEDTSNWQLDGGFDGVTNVQSSDPAREGGVGVEDTRVLPEQSGSTTSLAVGEMEDDGIGEETTAKVEAFFGHRVPLDSPSVSSRGGIGADAAAAIPAALAGSSSSSNNSGGGGRDGGAGGGRGAISETKDPGRTNGGGEKGAEYITAEMWMYGGVGGGGGGTRAVVE